MRRRNAGLTAMLLAGLLAASAGCRPAPGGADAARPELGRLLAGHRGRATVLLLGREGCPGTERATAVLAAWAREKPRDVDFLRLDVPLPAEKDYRPTGEWPQPFPRAVDDGRRVAGELEFFFYPTLYVFDRDGALRFAGGCERAGLERMLGEILAEKRGRPKRSYTLQPLAAGVDAPDFKAQKLGGGTAGLAELRGERGTLLFFSDTRCPFTVKELENLAGLAAAHRAKGLAAVVIDRGADAGAAGQVYGRLTPGLPVVLDRDGAIFKAYAVDAVPFYYLLDGGGKVVRGRSFTPAAAGGSIAALLGVGEEPLRFKPAEAG
jgi:peroxiredoxin